MAAGPAAHGATQAVAAFALRAASSPPAHATHLTRALLDTLASALAASDTEAEQVLRRWSDRERTSGLATVWTTGRQVSPSLAAFLNGTAGHVLDWDDVSPSMPLHPSTVLLPALVAVGEEIGSSGAALSRAHDVGAAVLRAVAEALPHREHYARGWHMTSTAGRLAATAAVAALRGLDGTTTRHALGLVASLAAGSRANFGTMTKPLHAGAAARDAVTATDLAADGFTANTAVLEAPGGFFDLYGDRAQQDLSTLADDLERWRTGWPEDWALKMYPACYATHRAIDAALELREQLDRELPRSVDVTVGPGDLRPLLTHEPTTGMEAKFSMAYVVSTALVHGDVRLGRFTDEAVRDVVVRDMMGRVRVSEATGPSGPSTGYAIVGTSDGARREVRVVHAYGDSHHPMTDDDLQTKFADACAVAGLDRAGTAALADAVTGLAHADDVRALHAPLAASTTSMGGSLR